MPATWGDLLEELRPAFRRRSTHRLFVLLACGMILAGRRTVVAMAAAAGIADQFRRACWFFSGAVQDVDDLGLAVARLIVTYLVPAGAPVTVAVDGTFFKRWGRKVAEARWAYDGSAQGGKKIAYGNTQVIAAIVVKLPFCSSPAALPVLFRLWRGKGTASQVALAAEMVKLLAGAFPDQGVHGVGDAAFHGEPLVIEGTTWTTRLPASAVLYGPKPPRTGQRGRPRVKGARLGKPAQIAAAATWQEVTVTCYGHTAAMQASAAAALWHGSFGTAPGRLVLVKEPGSATPYDLAIFTPGTAAAPEAVIERYAWRWPIEPSNAAGKQIMGAGDACNRVTTAVERTVPFGFLVQTLLICWYARYAYDPADVERRRLACPWYVTKTEPSTAGMLARLRREFLTARFPAIRPGQTPPGQIPGYAWTCDTLAA
ncbi:MAG TPA: transposase [Streptosporangiaceae bacterium]|nr:transposase [Streptosporangiaceae bacterium]